jgi:hypothetical protein
VSRFISKVLGAALKDNEHLEKGVLTGVLNALKGE